MDTVETGFLSVRITAPGDYFVQFEPCIQHGGRTALMEDAEGAALLQYLRALSPGAVSYTHLAVYKRQRGSRASARLSPG